MKTFVATFPDKTTATVKARHDLVAAVVGKADGRWVVVDPNVSLANAKANCLELQLISSYEELRVVPLVVEQKGPF